MGAAHWVVPDAARRGVAAHRVGLSEKAGWDALARYSEQARWACRCMPAQMDVMARSASLVRWDAEAQKAVPYGLTRRAQGCEGLQYARWEPGVAVRRVLEGA